MRPPRGLVVGTGRSGTGYVARVLESAGLNTGHEAWWRPGAPLPTADGLDYDVSWLGLRDAYSWRGAGRPLVLATRDPLLTFKSYAAKAFWNNSPDDPYYRTQLSMFRRYQHTGNRVVDAAVVVVELGLAAMAYCQWMFAVERMSANDVQRLAQAVDHPVSFADATRALARVPHDVNHHGAYVVDDDVQAMLEMLPVKLLNDLNHLRTVWGY